MYIAHYGLNGQPFQLTPDARFWFESRTHRKAMAYLGYGIAQGDGFIVITGEIGAGKSTLAAHLLATIDRARLNAISLVSTQVEGDDMLRLVAQRLGIETSGASKAQLLDQVEQRLEEETAAAKRTLLIVDEAQALSTSALEELRMLSNFQRRGRPLVQILLLGQPEFHDRLADPALEQLRQRVIASHHLTPMGEDEVGPYLRHRLSQAGWQGRPDFTPLALVAIHRNSGGIGRRINQIANRLLLQAALEDQSLIDVDQVQSVVAEMDADARPLAQKPQDEAPAPEPAAAPQEKVLPLRSAHISPAAEASVSPAPTAPDPALARRLAALEAKTEEQEAMLRRVLTLLVDWVENSSPETAYRTHAA